MDVMLCDSYDGIRVSHFSMDDYLSNHEKIPCYPIHVLVYFHSVCVPKWVGNREVYLVYLTQIGINSNPFECIQWYIRLYVMQSPNKPGRCREIISWTRIPRSPYKIYPLHQRWILSLYRLVDGHLGWNHLLKSEEGPDIPR